MSVPHDRLKSVQMTTPWKQSSWLALEEWRKEQKLSAKALGELLGVTERTLQRWKSGESAPHLSVQAAIEQMIAGKASQAGQSDDATSAIVTTYLTRNKRPLTPEQLIELVRGVREALRGVGEEE